jgi:excisionase family DNA binding protein
MQQQTTPSPTKKKAKTINEICRIYDVSRTLVYKEMDNGALPYLQIGGVRRITPEDEAAWLKRKAVDKS